MSARYDELIYPSALVHLVCALWIRSWYVPMIMIAQLNQNDFLVEPVRRK